MPKAAPEGAAWNRLQPVKPAARWRPVFQVPVTPQPRPSRATKGTTHFRTGEVCQAYLAGIETDHSLPLESLTGEPKCKQVRLLAVRDTRFITIGEFERRRDLEDVATRIFVNEQSEAIATALSLFSE